MPNIIQGSDDKWRRYRARLKASGMRQMHIWVPDTKRPGFAEEMRRQLALTETPRDDDETLGFIESAFDWKE
jgi:hypothetical protein